MVADVPVDARFAVGEALLRAESVDAVGAVIGRELAAAAGACRARFDPAARPTTPVAAAAAAGEAIWLGTTGELEARYPAWHATDGAQAWAALPIAPGGAHQDRPRGVLALDFATTQRFEATQQAELRGLAQLVALALDRADLLDRQRAITQFSDEHLGIFAHDVRSPLGAISLTADTLLTGQPDAVARKRFELVLRGTRRMERLLKQIVDYARARHGSGLRMSPTVTDLAALAHEAIGELRPRTTRTIDLVTEGDPGGVWDPDRVGQVVANLLDNAVDHGSPEAPVAVRIDGTAPAQVRLSITNGGVIDPATLPHVFDPFRGGRPRTRSSGLGLGLPLSRTIVKGHRGTITCTSSAEAGTTFVVDLPRRLA